VVITAGRCGDSPQFQVVLGHVRVPRPGQADGRLKRNRAVASRYHKLAVRYEATVHLAAINEGLPRYL
jgi:hypothetical protein